MESTLRRGAGAPGLRLIETLGWHGTVFTRLDLHMMRLAASAARLGWNCDAALVKAALFDAVGMNPARVRLTLDVAGAIAVDTTALPPSAPFWRVGLAGERLSSGDPWLSVKSTNRAVYDGARASMAAGLDEVIFLNERNEVCDGSITTVFFDVGKGLCTPPLVSGVLPGVLRAELIATGAVRERVLHAGDLDHAQLMIGNSLRGLIPAVFVHQIRA